jgi:hypothetical protein
MVLPLTQARQPFPVGVISMVAVTSQRLSSGGVTEIDTVQQFIEQQTDKPRAMIPLGGLGAVIDANGSTYMG